MEREEPDQTLKVPGASASTMHAGIWDLAFSALLRARTSFSSFAHSILAGRAPAERAPKEQVWPMPLPFPEVHCKAKSRQKAGASLKLGVNYIVMVLNWLHVGEQLCDVSALRLGTKLNLAQWQVVRRISPLVSSWNSQGSVASADMGRSAAEVESIESELRRLEEAACCVKLAEEAYFKRRDEQSSFGFAGAPGEEAGVLAGGGIEHLAKDIEPDRLFFHGVPSFDPEPFLDYNNRMTYRRPLDFAEAIDVDDPKLPRVKLRCPASQRIRVLEKLDSVQRLALLDGSRCRRGLENGLFSIPKDQARDRMILDARRANAAESSERRWIYSLASVQQFLHVFLAPHEHMELNAEDLREFYHCFVVGAQRQERNILQGGYAARDLRHLRAYRPELEGAKEVVAALDTLAMGDTNAVAYGQVAHLSLLLRTGHFTLEDFITLKNRPSRKKWHAGLMIDDFVLIEICEKDRRSEEVRRMIEDVRAAYITYGLPRHEGKAVEHATEGEFWGIQLDGVRGTLRPSLKRLVPLANITLKTVQLGYSTVGLLEVLAGCFVAAFQVRRRLMSALEHIYSAQRLRSRSTIVKLSDELRNELLAVVGLLPLAVIDMRIKPSSTLIASDASTQAEAAVAVEIGEERTAEFQKHGIQKGLWNRLLSPSASYLRSQGLLGAEEELPCSDEYKMHPIWEEVVSCGQFRPFGKTKKVRSRKHINLGELDAALRAEEKLFREQPEVFYVHLVDFQVVAACLVKGRSSSASVNRRLRASIAAHVGQGGRSFIGYVRSKLNPADDPTRGAALRKPRRAFSKWWHDLEVGSFEELDEFLRQRGFLPLQLAELPEEEELYPDVEMDWSSAASRRAARGRSMRDQRTSFEAKARIRLTEDFACQAAKCKCKEEREAGEAFRDDEGFDSTAGVGVEAGGRRQRTEDESTENADAEAEITTEVEITEAEITEDAEIPAETAGTEAENTEDAEAEDEKAEAAEREKVKVDLANALGPAKKREAESRGEQGKACPNRYGLKKEFLDFLLARDPDQFILNSQYSSIEEAVRAGPGLLDLFSGKRGFARAFVQQGCPWAICFDLKDGEDKNLLEPQLQRDLRTLLSAGVFRAMAAGPVCASFSTAITPPWRTRAAPRGRTGLTDEQQLKISIGHSQLLFTLELVEICLRIGVIFWIENPDGSWFWRMDEELSWDRFMTDGRLGDFRVDQCRLGTAWRKRTRFRTNSHLKNQRLLCCCTRPHVLLRGRNKVTGQNYTKMAESYPRKLCSLLAGAFAIDTGLDPRRRRINVSACVRDPVRRIGEAKNPGPRQRRQPRAADLDAFDLLEPQTILMRKRLWTDFEAWVAASVAIGTVDELLVVPPVLAKVLEAYGRFQFAAGVPRHYFRQLLAHTQREYPSTRSSLGPAWGVVSKWEVAEPLQHRTPAPEPLVTAMAVLGFLWRWPRFSCTVLLSFHGILRIGEALQARRCDLLTPLDLMEQDQKFYLKIRQPKSRNRGAKVQYATFENEMLMPLLLEYWQKLQPDELLFPFSPAVFRRRWDAILQKLGVSSAHRLTPGSVRGGGAVAAHKRGVGINDLLWKMRLQHQRTLGYYLQEMTAASIMPLLPAETRADIQVLTRLMPLLAEEARSAQARSELLFQSCRPREFCGMQHLK